VLTHLLTRNWPSDVQREREEAKLDLSEYTSRLHRRALQLFYDSLPTFNR